MATRWPTPSGSTSVNTVRPIDWSGAMSRTCQSALVVDRADTVVTGTVASAAKRWPHLSSTHTTPARECSGVNSRALAAK